MKSGKKKANLNSASFGVRLYISLSMYHVLKMRTGNKAVDEKIIDLLQPLLEEINEKYHFSA